MGRDIQKCSSGGGVGVNVGVSLGVGEGVRVAVVLGVGVVLGVYVVVGVPVFAGVGLDVGVGVSDGSGVAVGVTFANSASTWPLVRSSLRAATPNRSTPAVSNKTYTGKVFAGGRWSDEGEGSLTTNDNWREMGRRIHGLRSWRPGDSFARPIEVAAVRVAIFERKKHMLAAAVESHGPDCPLAAAVADERNRLPIGRHRGQAILGRVI